MEESNQNYEIKVSRNGLSVPVVNGIHLHSIYNPVKEAEAFAQGHSEVIKQKNNILILGLGYGYHIEQVAKLANQSHSEYKIFIIEPNTDLAVDFNTNRPFEDKNIIIFSAKEAHKLFEDLEFVNFLKTKPAIIKHDTSFGIEKEFYVEFLKYQAPRELRRYAYMLSETSKAICGSYMESDRPISGIAEDIQTKDGIQSDNDFLILALDEIKYQFSKQTRGA